MVWIWLNVLLVSVTVGGSWAFTVPVPTSKKRSATSTNMFFDFFKNPLEEVQIPATDRRSIFIDKLIQAPFDPDSEDDLIARAKTVLMSDLGILDGGRLLDNDFIWIGATSNGDVLGKVEYLAAGKFFELRYGQAGSESCSC